MATVEQREDVIMSKPIGLYLEDRGFYTGSVSIYAARYHWLQNPMINVVDRRVFQVLIYSFGEFRWINVDPRRIRMF